MIWTKASITPPPRNVPIYVQFEDDHFVELKMITEENTVYVTKVQWEILRLKFEQEGLDEDEIDDKKKDFRIIQFWSFIPVFPLDEINPYLARCSNAIAELTLAIEEIKKELSNLPRLQSIYIMIENLQTQIATLKPDSYHTWKTKRISESLVPLGNSGVVPPPSKESL